MSPAPSRRARPARRSATLAAAIAALPAVEVRAREPLARHTTLRIGGPAELFVEVPSQRALVALLRLLAAAPAAPPFHLLGLGSNVLAPDEGLPGVVARLGGELRRVRVRGELVSAGAALPLALLARRLGERGLVGLEALSGFPSTVGGAVYMNAGCYGSEIKDLLVSATVVDRAGVVRRLSTADLHPGYRSTALQDSGTVVTRAVLRLRRGDPAQALARIEELNARRRASLPSGHPNAGSIFKNPPGDYAGRLIEACGLKGRIAGAAQVSPHHANVIVNLGGARAADVLALMIAAFRAVERRFAIRLEPEIVLLGALRAAWKRRAPS